MCVRECVEKVYIVSINELEGHSVNANLRQICHF